MNRTLIALLLLLAVVFSGPVIPIYELPAESFASSEILQLLKDAGCTLCDDLSNCTQGDMMLAPNEGLFTLDVIFYNGTVARTPITNAPLIVYVRNATTDELYKIYTGSDGVASFSFEQWSGSCHDYIVFHCKGQYGCDFTTCVDAVGINRTDLGVEDLDDIPIAPDGTMSGGEQNPINVLPTFASYRYCPPPPALGDSMPVFCLPLILIMMFLLGSMFLSGKNPFIFFDFSSPRMGKYIRYTARGRGFGFDVVSMASAVTSVVSIAKNPKGMMKKEKEDLKKGAAFGGVAMSVRGGGLAAKKGVGDTKGSLKMGARWGKGGGKAGLKSFKDTALAGLKVTTLGRIISSSRDAFKGQGQWKGRGGTKAGWKALAIGILSATSFGPLVRSIETAVKMFSIFGSKDSANEAFRKYKGEISSVYADEKGEKKQLVTKLEFNKEKNKWELVPYVFNVKEDPKAPGGFVRVGVGQRFTDLTQITLQGGGSGKALAEVMKPAEALMSKYHGTMVFFGHYELADRVSDLQKTLKENKALSSYEGSVSLRVIDKDGTKASLSVADLRNITEDGSGVKIKTTSTNPDGTTKTSIEIVSSAEFSRREKTAEHGTKVESLGQMELSRITSSLDTKGDQGTLLKGLGISKTVTDGAQIEGVKQMTAVSQAAYMQIERMRESWPAEQERRVKELKYQSEGPMPPEQLAAKITIEGQTKTLEQWKSEGKMEQVLTTLAALPADGAPKYLSKMAEAARNVYMGEGFQAGNLARAFGNTVTLTTMMENAPQMSHAELLRASAHGQLVITQLAAASRGRLIDASSFEGLDFKGMTVPGPAGVATSAIYLLAKKPANEEEREKRDKFIKEMEVSRKEIENIPQEYRSSEQSRILEIYGLASETAKSVAHISSAKSASEKGEAQAEFTKNITKLSEAGRTEVTLTESEALSYKRQILATAADFFSRASPSGASGARIEVATSHMLQDVFSNPKDALRTMTMYEALNNAKDDPERFNRLYSSYEKYSESSSAKERDAAYEKAWSDDSKANLRRSFVIDAMGRNGAYESAVEEQVRKMRETEAARPGETRAEAQERYVKVDNLRESYQSAQAAYEAAQKRYDEAQKKKEGEAEPGFKHKSSMDLEAARTALVTQRSAYHSELIDNVGGTSKAASLIDSQSPTRGWTEYKRFESDTSKMDNPDQVKEHLSWLNTSDMDKQYHGVAPEDPFKGMRDRMSGAVSAFGSSIGSTYPPRAPPFNYDPGVANQVTMLLSEKINMGSGIEGASQADILRMQMLLTRGK